MLPLPPRPNINLISIGHNSSVQSVQFSFLAGAAFGLPRSCYSSEADLVLWRCTCSLGAVALDLETWRCGAVTAHLALWRCNAAKTTAPSLWRRCTNLPEWVTTVSPVFWPPPEWVTTVQSR